jgi:hypothetical protein
VFDGDADEIPFAALNTGGFLNAIRDIVDEERIRPQPVLTPTPTPAANTSAFALSASMWIGLAQVLEGACALLTEPTAAEQIPKDLRARMRDALRAAADHLGAGSTE